MQKKKTYVRKNQLDCSLKKKIDRRGKPKNLNKFQLQPSNSWAGDQCCIRLVTLLTKTRILNLHQTNIRSLSQVDQYAEQQIVKQCPQSKKQRIQIIKDITLEKYLMNDQFIGCVVFFFKSNYEDVILQELDDLGDHVKSVFQKVWQLLNPKFIEEFTSMLRRHKGGEQIETIASNLLYEANLSQEDNTIIQYQFIKYCYDKSDLQQDKIEEYFLDWKTNLKGLIIENVATFIKEIFQTLQVCTLENNY